ncbi:HD domain-containing phosphohydrolase [Dokdonella sp.]|uniref:HD domain-containing phosphohydrolase n=1 Tax=Dokdonella sp. TaxID=2291710 RepID=UPI0031C17CCD|nr:response regulator [Dokdonella sp.]
MNVLIVDDQNSARTMLRHVVEAIGPGVHATDFANPVAALQWSEQHVADLVLLDYRMPEMDGLEFARRFRRPLSRRDVPIVLISVVGDEPLRNAALDAGVIDFMVKPVRPRELRSRCKNLLQLRQHGESLKERAHSLQQRVLEGLHEVEQRERETLYRLAKAAEIRDPGAGLSLLRMSHYTEAVAEAMGLPEDEVGILTLAAPLHDIGKIGIPDAVLLKRGRLDDAEMAIMRRHPVIGHEVLRDSSSRFVQQAAMVALRHHERWDGSGYPDGLAGEAIPLGARIVAVADVFDALTSERPYKAAWGPDEAFAYMAAHRGTLFDKACVDALLGSRARMLDILQARLVPPG